MTRRMIAAFEMATGASFADTTDLESVADGSESPASTTSRAQAAALRSE